MRKLLTGMLGVAALGLGALGLASGPASAAPDPFPGEHLDWGYQLEGDAETACPSGSPVINVVHKVTNDMDSGTGGNFWAVDEYVRSIQVVQTGVAPDTFCATVKYKGSFETVAGDSPGCDNVREDGHSTCKDDKPPPGDEGDGTADLSAGVVGTFQGGYTATITGSLAASPGSRTKGSIGSFDYKCDPTTDPGDRSTCTGLFNWLDEYFASVSSFAFYWWGWVYHAGNNGSWVNAADPPGNSGDITGN